MSIDAAPAVPLVTVQHLTQAEYRADPKLATHSRVRKLLPPSTPAHARHELDNPTTSDAFDFGKAAHRMVLGAGDDLVVITGTGKDPNAWRTDADIKAVAAARAEGATPIRPRDLVIVHAMAKALREHQLAAALLDPGRGAPEQVIMWPDERIPAVQRGTMIDWLPDYVDGRRLLVPDYKTAEQAHPQEWARTAANFGYHSQAAWNLDALHALHPDLTDEQIAFLFIVQSKQPPYPVAIVELLPEDIRIGRAQNTWAIQLWHQCWETGRWPGYGDEVHEVALPEWYRDRWRTIA